MTEAERLDFLDICPAGYQARSTLLTSQLREESWQAQIADPTIDRVVHNARRTELKGESMGSD